jgi:hypothetical protein
MFPLPSPPCHPRRTLAPAVYPSLSPLGALCSIPALSQSCFPPACATSKIDKRPPCTNKPTPPAPLPSHFCAGGPPAPPCPRLASTHEKNCLPACLPAPLVTPFVSRHRQRPRINTSRTACLGLGGSAAPPQGRRRRLPSPHPSPRPSLLGTAHHYAVRLHAPLGARLVYLSVPAAAAAAFCIRRALGAGIPRAAPAALAHHLRGPCMDDM